MQNNLGSTNMQSTAYRFGAWSSCLLMLYSLATILIVFLIGGPPTSVAECFQMLAENRVTGLLRLDILTVFVMPTYYVLFYGLYLALRNVNHYVISMSALFIVAGVTIFLAAPSVFSYVRLSDAYLTAATEIEKNRAYAAAEAVLAADIWNGTGPRISGLMVQIGATAMSLIMLRSKNFSKLTAGIGIVTHGLDLAHIVTGFFSVALANSMMAVAGTLYLLWFPLVAVALFRLARENS